MRLETRALFVLLVAALTFAACDGDGGQATEETAPASEVESDNGAPGTTEDLSDEEAALKNAEEMAEEVAEDLEEAQEAVGGGSATLVTDDQTWTFDSVLCAFGEDQIGQEGAVFNLSAIQDGLQLYVSIDSFGHSVTLDDVQNFENPSVALNAGGPIAGMMGNPDEFIELDNQNVSADVIFLDDTTDGMDAVEGTLEATCP